MDRIYVKTGANGTGLRADDAVGTLEKAAELIKSNGGEIVLCGTMTIAGIHEIPEMGGDLTITAAEGAKVTFLGELGFAKNTNDNTITLDFPCTARESFSKIFGGFNNIVFGKNFVVNGGVDFYGGVKAGLGEMRQAAINTKLNNSYIAEKPYSIAVENGTFGTFVGGNYRIEQNALFGSIAAPLTVTVNGGTFLKAFSLSGMSFLADDATLTVNGGTFNCSIYAQGSMGAHGAYGSYNSIVTMRDPKYYAVDGTIAITLNGGTFSGGTIAAEEDVVSFRPCLRGDFSLTIGKDAKCKVGTVLDATQVKAYAGKTNTASLTVPNASTFKVVRFDKVNGAAQTYSEPLRITFVGDSITQGTGSSNLLTKTYAAQVYTLAKKDGRDVVIGNYGVGASTVMNYSQVYYNTTLAYRIAFSEADGDYVLIALGTNDASIAGGTQGQTNHFAADYEKLLRSFGSLPDTEKVFTTSSIYRLTSNKAADVRAVSVIRPTQEAVTLKLASEMPEKYVYIDLYALLLDAAVNDTLFASDKLHPDDNGYVIYGKAVYDAIFNGVCDKEIEKTDIYISARGKLFGKGTKENPMSSLTVALGSAAEEATIHVIGTFTYPEKIVTPLNLKKLTIVGEGDDAKFVCSGDTFKFLSDAKVDNIHFGTTVNATHLCANYNNLELTESFSCDPKYRFVGGRMLFGSDISKGAYDNTASATGDKDVTITVNGGSFAFLVGGNYRFAADAPIGTYSGNMQLTIGKNVTIAANTFNGIVGQNQLTGTVHATVLSWPAGSEIKKYAPAGSLAGVKYTESANTGTVTISTEAPATAGVTLKMTLGKTDYTVNGEQRTMDVAPIIANSRTMLPVRYVAEALGATILWDGATSTATLKTADTEIKITVGAAEAVVNGKAVTLDSPAFIESSRTYMPVRFVAETLGATVIWDGATSTATITKK